MFPFSRMQNGGKEIVRFQLSVKDIAFKVFSSVREFFFFIDNESIIRIHICHCSLCLVANVYPGSFGLWIFGFPRLFFPGSTIKGIR